MLSSSIHPMWLSISSLSKLRVSLSLREVTI
jgi:hypothetical protein